MSVPLVVSVPSFLDLYEVSRMQLLFTTTVHCATSPKASATFPTFPSIKRKALGQPRLNIPHVRVQLGDDGPVHGLQRSAFCPAVACAKSLESVAATRVHHTRELVHAIAGLQVRWRSTQHTREPSTKCKRQSIRLPMIRLPAIALPPPTTEHGRK